MKSNKYTRVFCIVIDSLGVGCLPDAATYGDANADTFGHILDYDPNINIPNLSFLGLTQLHGKGYANARVSKGYYYKAMEQSIGKDTICGHHEMMGLVTTTPFQTFPEGFSNDFMEQLELVTNHIFIANEVGSGTEMLKKYGEQHMKDSSLILYTSADSVLQIAAHEDIICVEELYRICSMVRAWCIKSPYNIARVIARPFVGSNATNFKRTSNRRDYALDPTSDTLLSKLKKAHYDVIAIGKIDDIFHGNGITQSLKSTSSVHGMQQTIQCADDDIRGLIYTNLVDFDALWGHRRDIKGYKEELEHFDEQLGVLLKTLREGDLLVLCADHGNDPSFTGSDHTREYVPVLLYSPIHQGSGLLPLSKSFVSIANTIAENFNIELFEGDQSYYHKLY